MCLCDRPDYTRRVLASLRACDGIGDYRILPHCEPGDDHVRALVEGIDFAECLPTFNASRLGVNPNTENALLDGFGLSGFVIHVEDDILLAPDALRFYEWCRDRFATDPRVFSATSYNRRPGPAGPDELHRVRLRKWFHPWGWATWRDRWGAFSGSLHKIERGTWDARINERFCAGGRGARCQEAYPELSRSQNIGVVSSRRRLPREWFEENMHLRHWAGNHAVPIPDAPFRE